MDIQSTINTDEMYRRFSAVEYSKLNDTFRNAIEKSLEILKQATLSNLRSTGIDVTSPVKKGGQSYNPLIKGVISEVSADGTKGRVKVTQAGTRKGYGMSSESGSFALKWFELGTQERFRKGNGYTWKANSNSGQGGARKHRNKGASTGRIKRYGFFEKATEQTTDQVNKSLEDNVTKAIQKILEK